MQDPPHLTDEQVARYRNRTLAPADLLDVDSHISDCEQCRDLTYAGVCAGPRIAALRAELSGHLDYAGIVACASGSASAEQRGHLENCADCRGEVEDLRSFQVELRETPQAPVVMPVRRARSWRLPLTIAAGVVLVFVSVWTLRQQKAPQ